jgi:pantothenate kinase
MSITAVWRHFEPAGKARAAHAKYMVVEARTLSRRRGAARSTMDIWLAPRRGREPLSASGPLQPFVKSGAEPGQTMGLLRTSAAESAFPRRRGSVADAAQCRSYTADVGQVRVDAINDPADSLLDLIRAARLLIKAGQRSFLGITGAPGSGKSTLAEMIEAELAPDAVLVGMDGFHLSDTELRRLGRYERKGAIDTFDAAGYVNLLRRLHSREDPIVYAPRFDRSIEESIGSAIPIPRDVPLIITEGNYLLVEDSDWGNVRGLLDECWYVEPGDEERRRRLTARHVEFGRNPEEAHERSHRVDERNAEMIKETKRNASRIVRVETLAQDSAKPKRR